MYLLRRYQTQVIIAILLLVAIIAAILLWPLRAKAALGPAIAICPGPDLYGYTCESGDGFAYIDATNDTFLYQDDGIVTIPLPFPFTFYGTTYTEVNASSNGNLQFANRNAYYFNQCMHNGPVAGMGDMIAPFWDDLDLVFYGYLETITVGDAPNRIFVIEWDDIPPYGATPDEGVTFAVQLFEGSNDIVFLYENAGSFNRSNGRSATIGLQSENQGVSLQYGCNQPVVSNATGLYFPHPERPNPDLGQDVVIDGLAVPLLQAKGPVAELIAGLDRQGAAALSQLRSHWLSQSPQRISEFRWLDLTGNGRDDLIFLWRGTAQEPELAQLVVLSADEAGQMSLQFDKRFSSRQEHFSQMSLVETADLTQDGRPDLLLLDQSSQQLFLLTHSNDQFDLIAIPERCTGSLAVVDVDGNGRLAIARDGCAEGRVILLWNGRSFAPNQTTP